MIIIFLSYMIGLAADYCLSVLFEGWPESALGGAEGAL
jgi:hypothetical protein